MFFGTRSAEVGTVGNILPKQSERKSVNLAVSPFKPAWPAIGAVSTIPSDSSKLPARRPAPTGGRGACLSGLILNSLFGFVVSGTIPPFARFWLVVSLAAHGRASQRLPEFLRNAVVPDNEEALDCGNELMASDRLPKDEVFERLFELHQPWLQRWFVSSGFTIGESEDLTQETFVKVYRGLDGFRGESSVGTWIKTIATRLALNHKRASQAQKRRALEISLDQDESVGCQLESDSAAGPLQLVLHREVREYLEKAIEALPRQRRRCLMLRVRGYKYKEIAFLLGISIEAVKSQLNQARNQLKPVLSEHFSGIRQDVGDDS